MFDRLRKLLLVRKVQLYAHFENSDKNFYVVRVPDGVGADDLANLTKMLNETFEANFIVAPESVNLSEITAEVGRSIAEAIEERQTAKDAEERASRGYAGVEFH